MNNSYIDWIFNNCSLEKDYCYIHFPHIYLTKNKLNLQTYADSILKFLELNDLKIYANTVDLLVVEFLERNRLEIQNTALNNLGDTNFLNKIKTLLTDIYYKYPDLCLKMEKNILDNKKINYKMFKDLYDYDVTLVAISQFHSLVTHNIELILNDSQYDSLVEEHLYKNNFSHIAYINEEFEKLKLAPTEQKIVNFCWNTGFAKDIIGDGAEFEDIAYIQELINTNFDLSKNIKPNEFYYPDIKLADNKITGNIEYILHWAKIIQSSLEFRHYWCLRFHRNAKILLDKIEDSYIWTLEDYEKRYFKIK